MKLNKKATSIIEAIIIILIVVTWVTWMYKIYSNSIKLATWTKNKIQAIQIATQWIEAFTNIRDTNWQVFPGDTTNCRNTLNYDWSCIWATNNNHRIGSWSYIIYIDNSNFRWNLSKKTWLWSDYSDSTYRSNFRVWLNSKSIYTQTWVLDNLKPIYTREILVSYPDWTFTWSLLVKSKVMWADNTTNTHREVELEQILTNWKK